MPTYDEWNEALIGYLTRGVSRGGGILLDINDDILEDIGRQAFKMKSVNVTRWPDDFKRAVRAKCILGTRVSLQNLFGYTSNELPRGVAFLGAMVLAAYYMGEDDAVTSVNYFKRLREVLGLGEGEGRPDGMEQGSEEAICEEYEEWVASGRGAVKNRESMKHFKTRNLFAELYRITELGIPTYYPYPRQPRRFRLPQLQVRRKGILEDLVEDHPGWFEPLWKVAVSGEELENGAQYELLGDADFQYLILPTRD